MNTEGVWYVETLLPPSAYGEAQLFMACAIARALGRGKLVLCEDPWGGPDG